HIGTYEFSSCENLSSASFYGSKEPSTNGPVFSQSDELTEVNVPTVYENETFCGIPVAKTIILPAQTSTAPTEASQTSSSASTSTPTYEFTPSLDPEDDNGSSSLGTGAIIGIITGSVVPILTAIIGAGWAIKHNKCCYKEQKQEIHIDGTGHEIVIKA
ncbi:MAG: hypothetical protein IJ758_04460, partial [Clostridia bacterium]|nr:hypothetical protein [Clostridia bacterium]